MLVAPNREGPFSRCVPTMRRTGDGTGAHTDDVAHPPSSSSWPLAGQWLLCCRSPSPVAARESRVATEGIPQLLIARPTSTPDHDPDHGPARAPREAAMGRGIESSGPLRYADEVNTDLLRFFAE